MQAQNRGQEMGIGISTGAASTDFVIPILCYHSWAADGHGYASDNHLALESDLRVLAARGYQIISLPLLATVLRGEQPAAELIGHKLVGLSFDDGWDYDYYALKNPQGNPVKSIHALLVESQAWLAQFDTGPRGVAFVIASPQARQILERACGAGVDRWQDVWWAACAAEGILGIANHSWDHLHEALPQVRQREQRKGSFLAVECLADAESQIAEAQDYIQAKTQGHALPLFGYPYGDVSSYLRDDYFPQHGDRIGIQAAFATGGTAVRPGVSPWAIPRLVCGEHWCSAADFPVLLDAIESGTR